MDNLVDVGLIAPFVVAGMILSGLVLAFLAWKVMTQKPKPVSVKRFDASPYLLVLLLYTAVCAASAILGMANQRPSIDALVNWGVIFAWGFGIWAFVVTIHAIVFYTRAWLGRTQSDSEP